jgi:alkylation response protein AidB-like acyl-CoA dehydrogenase
MTSTNPAELTALVGEFDRLVRAHSDTNHADAGTVGMNSQLWSRLVAGGWFDIGRAEVAGGAGLGRTALLAFSEVWGRYLVPLPFSATLLFQALQHDDNGGVGAVTVAVDDGAELIAPHALPGSGVDVAVLAELSHLDRALQAHPRAEPDLAPSIPLAAANGVTTLLPDAAALLRALFAAEAVGAAAVTLERAVRYSGERVAYGRKIGTYQALRHLMADLARDLELSRSAIFWAGNTVGAENRQAALHAVKLARQIATGSIQIFGGIGFTWELGIHFYLKHILVLHQLVTAIAPPSPLQSAYDHILT